MCPRPRSRIRASAWAPAFFPSAEANMERQYSYVLPRISLLSPCSFIWMLVNRSTTSPSFCLSSSGRAKFFGRMPTLDEGQCELLRKIFAGKHTQQGRYYFLKFFHGESSVNEAACNAPRLFIGHYHGILYDYIIFIVNNQQKYTILPFRVLKKRKKCG